jgi:catechol 2,3-dioxygenase-like lactoylglutathione lyase family enzyme
MNSATTVSNSRVTFRSNCEIAIHVPDLAQAEAFYGGVLGFRLVTKSVDLLEFDTGSLRLFVNRDPEKLRTFLPSLDVPDFEAAKERC